MWFTLGMEISPRFAKIEAPASVVGRTLPSYQVIVDGEVVGTITAKLRPIRGRSNYATSYETRWTVRIERVVESAHSVAAAKQLARDIINR